MTPRELVLATLRGEATPRPPVICGGGMMSFAVVEAMDASGCAWPEAHHDAEQMARLALETQRLTAFDCVAVPFCMTVEAEALGAGIHFGTRTVQPWVDHEPMSTVRDLDALASPGAPEGDRRGVVLEAIRLLRCLAPDMAVIGATVGPLSLAAQVVEASLLLRATRRDPEAVRTLVARCASLVTEFALQQLEAGADTIAISDPTATGEVLGGRAYVEFAGPPLGEVVETLRSRGAPVIVHVCGCPNTIMDGLAGSCAECISVDETAALERTRTALPRQRLMGNISADLLQQGPEEDIARRARRILEQGADILSPACGVIAATPAAHLRVLADVAAGEDGSESVPGR